MMHAKIHRVSKAPFEAFGLDPQRLEPHRWLLPAARLKPSPALFLTHALLLLICLFFSFPALANIYGGVRGVVHDPQHRPIQGAMVMLRAKSSDWGKSVTTDTTGEFQFNAVPLGEYSVSVASPGFEQTTQAVTVVSGTVPVVHFLLKVAATNATVTVTGAPQVAPTDSATPVTLVDRLDIQRTPGADRTNSLALITDNVPGSYVTHDQLHIRGGHQTTWLVDGVPVPNTNIATNIGPQFDPKDIDYMEVNRGSYGAEFGDRTYGVFNVVPRTGFERNRQAELVLSAGNFYQTNDSLSFGSHSERFAYYVGLNGNRTNLGIQSPTPQIVHDAANGYGGFASFLFNVNPANQLRLVTALRRDYYQVPYDPNFNDLQSTLCDACDSSGLRDGERESDALVNASWVHTFNSRLMLTLSPLFHRNGADYESSPRDYPDATTDRRASTYAGGQANFAANLARNDLQAGLYGFHQNDSHRLGAVFNCPTNGDPNFPGCGGDPFPLDFEPASGGQAAFFVDDKFKPFAWLTLSAGMRPTHFSGSGRSENAISPRFGATLTVPRLHWTFRAFYGHYYQAPPLQTASGPLLQFAHANDVTFIPLRGERDEEHQFGVSIPYRGWTLDASTFRTRAQNFFDHDVIGNSNLFFPLTIEKALVRGWELTLHSPRIANRAQIHLAYSNQIVQGGGAITGGLTDFSTLDYGPLDHDQRNTLNLGADVTLPRRSYASTNIAYGSGFANAFPGQPYPGDYLPGHTTFDVSVGKDFGERVSASLNALNVSNRRIELDNSTTFGGFHWNNPREIFVELRYRFHF
jgi:TonB dependent receptor/Carboxypeptidase regulatory-like domain/TonB-dependent Receptor Plug Domain